LLISELGGFIITLITGGILMTAAAGVGWAIRWLTAERQSHRS
jgi:hypothetical protein